MLVVLLIWFWFLCTGVALCAGLLFGLITMLIQYVGLFMTGFHTGLLLAIAGLAIYDHFLESRPATVSINSITIKFQLHTKQ